MKYLLKFLKLPLRMKALTAEACFLLGFSRFIVLVFPFKKIAWILGKENTETVYSDELTDINTARRVSRIVQLVSRHTFWDSNCLAQAYAARIMLKRRKQPCTVYLGLARKEGGMKAHAWLRCGTVFVTGGNGSEYTVTGKFG